MKSFEKKWIKFFVLSLFFGCVYSIVSAILSSFFVDLREVLFLFGQSQYAQLKTKEKTLIVESRSMSR